MSLQAGCSEWCVCERQEYYSNDLKSATACLIIVLQIREMRFWN